MAEKHVLGISGGKDSAALAVFVRQTYPELDVDYFFTDSHHLRFRRALSLGRDPTPVLSS